MMYDLIVKNGQVFFEDKVQNVDIFVNDGTIVKIGSDEKAEAKEVIDASGKYVFPGFVDAHVHLNDPGLTNSEDFYTGTCAAAAGGVTTVFEHPLTNPLPSTIEAFDDKKRIGKEKVVVDFGLFGACDYDNTEDMKKIIESGASAFKLFLTYSSEIPFLNDGYVLEKMEFLKDKDIVLALHCENNDIVDYYTRKMISEGKIKTSDYPDGRPEIAELEAISRASLFAGKTGCKTNIAHCSLAEGAEIVANAKKNGANISVETCPQYLVLDRSIMDDCGVFSICNPPLRSKDEVEKLWKAVMDGKIDWVCSDHATYTFEEKLVGKDNCFDAPAGVTGIETTYQLLYSEGVVKRGMSIKQFVELSSTNAAKRYRAFPKKGQIAVGADADFAVLDPNEKWTIDENKLKQMIKWTPYNGMEVTGKVTGTIVRGKLVYDGENIVAESGSGKYIEPVK